MKQWGVYLLECADGSLYCGVTNDMDKRLVAHGNGKGAKYTRGRLPVSLQVFSGPRFSYSDALKHERRIKRLPKAQKISAVLQLRDGKPEPLS